MFYKQYSGRQKRVAGMNVSFQGHIPQSEKRKNTKWAVASAPLLAGSYILSEALVNKNLRKDTFIKTAKECAKNFTKDCRNLAAGFCKYVLRNENLANKVFKSSNNKLTFAIGFLVETLGSFGIMKFAMDSASKFHHRKDK